MNKVDSTDEKMKMCETDYTCKPNTIIRDIPFFLTEWTQLSESVPDAILPSLHRFVELVDGDGTEMNEMEMQFVVGMAKQMTDDMFCDACNVRTLMVSTYLMCDSVIQNYTNCLVPSDIQLLKDYFNVTNEAMDVVTDTCKFTGSSLLAQDTEYFGIIYDSCTVLPASYIGVITVCSKSSIFRSIYKKTINKIRHLDKRCLLIVFVNWLLQNNFLKFTSSTIAESMSHVPIVQTIVNFIQYRRGKMPTLHSKTNHIQEDELHRMYAKYLNLTLKRITHT